MTEFPGRRAGFTLIELLVALTLLGVGISAWVTTSAAALRLAGASDREQAAHRAARAQAERLAARCASSGGTQGGLRWDVRLRDNGVRQVRVEASYPGAGRPRLATFERVVVCR